MKIALLSLTLAALSTTQLIAQVVSIQMTKNTFTDKEEISFVIHCASEQDLEITVFTGECLIEHQTSTLIPGDNPFHFSTEICGSGKYFVLVAGKSIHEEKEFTVIKQK
jgi:hypothetical protein